MKKLITTFLVFILLSLLSIYFFIPGKIKVSKVVVINCNINAASRMILQNANWSRWWVNESKSSFANYSDASNSFIYKGISYQISNRLHNSIDIVINNGKYRINSNLAIFPLVQDSAAVQWKYNVVAGANLWKESGITGRLFS